MIDYMSYMGESVIPPAPKWLVVLSRNKENNSMRVVNPALARSEKITSPAQYKKYLETIKKGKIWRKK